MQKICDINPFYACVDNFICYVEIFLYKTIEKQAFDLQLCRTCEAS